VCVEQHRSNLERVFCFPLTQHKVNKHSKAKTNKVCKPN